MEQLEVHGLEPHKRSISHTFKKPHTIHFVQHTSASVQAPLTKFSVKLDHALDRLLDSQPQACEGLTQRQRGMVCMNKALIPRLYLRILK